MGERWLARPIALVTGATAGLGRAVAGALADHGMHVLAHGRDARRQRRLLSRAGTASGDLFVTAGQVMNTAIATNWHVAAAHTKP